jgi:D-threo-aldose 1-dehydrogenase
MTPTDKARIGKTGLAVTRMGIGGGALGGLYEEVPDTSARATVEGALALGINYVDTAPLYGHGLSERRVGQVLRERPRDGFVLSTKVGRLLVPAESPIESFWFKKPDPFEPVFDYSYDGVMRSVEESLKRTGLGRIDILFIHDPDDHYEEALGGAYPALHKLRSEGVVSAIGAGMNQAEMPARFARDADFDCFLLAGRYTLIDHSGLRDLLPLCLQKQISIIIGGPFNSGILAGGAVSGAKFDYNDASAEMVERVRRVQEVCARHSVPLKAAALQFPLAHPAVASVIPGARSAAEVEENFRLMAMPIPDDFWKDLRAEGLLPFEAPVPKNSEG